MWFSADGASHEITSVPDRPSIMEVRLLIWTAPQKLVPGTHVHRRFWHVQLVLPSVALPAFCSHESAVQ